MVNQAISRKLAVILHADVAGSTALVQHDETLAHERITDSFQEFSAIIQDYGGKVHEIRGDALVAEFARASDAVCASFRFQQSNAERNAQFEDKLTPLVRIGLALGEVVFADDTVTGAGVVLAQRIEQLAAPNGVCVTAAIHEALPQRMPFERTSIGEQEVKGFDEPVRVYRLELKPGESIPPAEPRNRGRPQKLITAVVAISLFTIGGMAIWLKPWMHESESDMNPVADKNVAIPAPSKPSIAVLPFDNLSGDPEQEYFADGMTDDLITDLSKISGLFVVARNSSFAYKGESPDVREVSRDLSVKFVLEGSVRRVGENVRINAQLIDATTGGHVWAERFDGSMKDVFSLQDEVNQRIVAALAVNLTADDRERLDKKSTTSPDAYDMLLRGLELYQRFNPEDNAGSREFFKKAVALDAGYARAYANVAWSYATEVNFNWTDQREESIQLGQEYVEKALFLDDRIPQIHMTRSVLYLAQRQHDAAVEAARRAVELHPNYADCYATLAFVLLYAGELEEALAAIHEVTRINPRSSYVYLAIEGRIQFLLGNNDAALVLLTEALERNPVFDRGHLLQAAIYSDLGNIDEANWSLEQALMLRPGLTVSAERQNSIYKREQDLNRHIDALRKAGLPE